MITYKTFSFSDSEHENFKPAYDKIIWLNEEEKFEKPGETGYPIVDAGMKELNATGFMYNRVRTLLQVLCKHLLIHWKKGESYFTKLWIMKWLVMLGITMGYGTVDAALI